MASEKKAVIKDKSAWSKKKSYRNSSEYLREYIQAYKARPCTDCKNQYFGGCTGDVMTFDHLPQFKKLFDIGWVSRKGAASGITFKKLVREIKKCEVVCWSCHRKRERKRGHLTNRKLHPLAVTQRRAEITERQTKFDQCERAAKALFSIRKRALRATKKEKKTKEPSSQEYLGFTPFGLPKGTNPFDFVWSDEEFTKFLSQKKRNNLMKASFENVFNLLKRLAPPEELAKLVEHSKFVTPPPKTPSEKEQNDNLKGFALSVARGCIYVARRDRLPLPIRKNGELAHEVPESKKTNANGEISSESSPACDEKQSPNL